jgi:hypothetical protein
MLDGAPATPDQPDNIIVTPLDRILSEHGVPRSLPPELLSYARERGLVLEEGEGEGEGEGAGEGTPGEGEGQPETGTESFMPSDFDPNAAIPDDAGPEWLAERYGQMNTHFTQRLQELGDGRREAEESQALIEGLRDPETLPHYLRLLGVDLTDPEMQQRFGITPQAAADELDGLLDDEPDAEERVAQLEALIAQEHEEGEAAAELQAYDELADQELEKIEGQWDRKLTDVEDEILRHRAENNPGPDGLPDYANAAKTLKGVLNQGVEHELKRRREGGGRGSLGGKPGGKALDLSKEEDRLSAGAAAAERAMASQQ